MATRLIVRNLEGNRVMVKHLGTATPQSEDKDLMCERLSEPDGDVLTGVRLRPKEHVLLRVGPHQSIRITEVAKLSAARNDPRTG